MAGIKVKFTLNEDTAAELDVLKSTLGQDVIDIRTLGSKGAFIFDPGFVSTTSYEFKITFTDDDGGILLYCGFPIGQLATDPNYLGARYILSNGEKPTQEQCDEFKTTVTRYITIHEQIICLSHALCRNSHPMAVMCGIIGVLTAFYHDSLDVNNPRHREIAALRLLPKMSTMATTCYKHSIGQPFVYPRNDLSYVGNLLNMMLFTPCKLYEVNPTLECAMDRILILHADHEQDASTPTMHITGSSGANPFTCIAAGTVSLWGPAHGGANEAALKMLEEISSVEHIPELVHRVRDKSDSFRLMGFGHRVYKNYDPRAAVMRETCHEVLKELGAKDDLLEVIMKLENIVLNDSHFIGKKLCPNVDFCSGIILKAMGIPSSMLTVILTMMHIVDWIAHWNEMHGGGMKVARPRQLCTGYGKRDFKSNIKC